ncbi:MAG: serine/threonine-protein kinase [Pseudomonadota bacterium]
MPSIDRSEEGRRFFQKRLALMFQVGLILSGAFLVTVVTIRGVFGASIIAELRSPSRLFHLVATLVLAAAWLYARRGVRSLRVLEIVDIVACLVLCVLLDLQAALFPVRSVAVFNLVLTTGIALILRAIVVPSPTGRTSLLGGLAVAAAIASFFASSHATWPVRQHAPDDWPMGYQFASLILWLGSLAAISVVASRVIYGLRREVRAARKLGQYVIESKIGEGGMGIVFRATHAMLRRETALKLLSPGLVDELSVQRFEREVVQTARLRHPNTVAIYDYGRTPDGVFYYAMEYLDGLTVERLVEDEGPLAPGRTVHLLAQVCASLDEAHEARLIHRDIKPANIMVMGHTSAWDLVKVLDFGLVKDAAATAEGANITNPALLIGTPQYMSPEAIAEPAKVGPQSDIYGVAAVGYFLLTGTPVFLEQTMIAICAAHLDQEPERPSARLGRAVPEDLERLLLSGLAKRPQDRPQTAQAFRQALLACDLTKWTEDDARMWWAKHLRKPLAAVDEGKLEFRDTLRRISVSMVGRGAAE